MRRLAEERAGVAGAVDTRPVQDKLNQVIKPRSLVGGMKKAGIALVATPDPFTGVPGVALIASAYVMKKREPVGLEHLALEMRKIAREMQSLRL